MSQALAAVGATRPPLHMPGIPSTIKDLAPSSWARADAGAAVKAPPSDGVVYPRIPQPKQLREMMPLTPLEHQQVWQLAPRLAPSQWASPHFNSMIPSMAIGPSSGTRYSFTCCPMNHAAPHGRKFTTDNFLDQAFKTGARTTISLTSQGDARHSEYYKQNTHGGHYSVSSSGRPSFTTKVLSSNGMPVTASIFDNAVRNNQTGEVRRMKMVHVNGWADQTALSADAQLKLISQLKDHLSNEDLRSMVMHCSEGRNRTGSFASMWEGADAVAKGRPPEIASKLNWFRSARVSDAVNVQSQMRELAECEVRLRRP